MNRIEEVFQKRKTGLLMTFTVAGDPDYDTSLSIMRALLQGGADIIELGLPFSDPAADGPVIQQADQRAIESGMNTDVFFRLVSEFRKESDIPLVVLTYTNLILQREIAKFYQDAANAGIDAVVVADLPYEEAGEYIGAAEQAGISPVMMVSTTTSPERLSRILSVKSGFIYLVAALGVTGVRREVNPEALRYLEMIKQATSTPVAPGFGISDREQVQEWFRAGADAVIVGSALVRLIGENLDSRQEMNRKITACVRELKE
ncbi:MAG: tryptophan synthase subunit alpha [Methanospirillum sp.]|nr:tryptophan synthase subunit alpha [Methanospirillum sp.]